MLTLLKELQSQNGASKGKVGKIQENLATISYEVKVHGSSVTVHACTSKGMEIALDKCAAALYIKS